MVVDENNDIRLIDLENIGGTEGWAHPDVLDGVDWSDSIECDHTHDNIHCSLPPIPGWAIIPESSPLAIPQNLPYIPESQSAEPPSPRPRPDCSGFPLPFNPPSLPITPLKGPTVEDKKRFQVFCFGKTAWDSNYVGDLPLNRSDLDQTPSWVQDLVHGCCSGDRFTSMDDVVSYLAHESKRRTGS